MIAFEFNTAIDTLSIELGSAIDKALNENLYETHSIEAKLNRSGSPDISIVDDTIYLDVPLKVLLKKVAGLFSAEGHGIINIHMAIIYHINDDLKLTIKSDILNHEWIEKPVIDFGAIDLPVTSIMDMMVKHYESIITGQIDNQINKSFNLKSILIDTIQNINSALKEQAYNGIRPILVLDEILLKKPKTDNRLLNISGALNVVINVTDQEVKDIYASPKFRWIPALAPDNIIMANVHVSHENLSKIILATIREQQYGGQKIDVSSCNILQKDKKTSIVLQLNKPISGKANINAELYYNEHEGKLYANDLDIKIIPDSFLYKLTAPLVNKYVESLADNYLPLDLQSIITEKWTELKSTSKEINNLKIEVFGSSVGLAELSFEERSIFGKVKAVGLKIAATLSDKQNIA